MAAELMDGVAVARAVREDVARGVADLVARGVTPGLAVVLVGEDPASTVYVRNKGKACEEAGMRSVTIRMPATTSQGELLAQVDALNADPAIHGILVQMPLPPQCSADEVIRRIDPAKDVDGFHPVNAGRLLIGDPDGFAPCTPAGVMELLRRYDVPTKGAEVVVIGRSNIVGKPMGALMIQPGVDATVTTCHSRTRDLAGHARRADILVAAIGRARFVTADMVKPGATVIDVGINRVEEPRSKTGYVLAGDVDFAAVREVAGRITPVPGGVGPLTIAMLLKNTLRAASRVAP
ncbi:MAG: bifunctional 5,10-methylene-tetrahydrofolate dehydrogenase/5,10-methylene-tetrahydrofolate cyclohydrolase [Gemmatimonadaceae bacterium]|jgi:methylenetetrahydrofolate dehydrogenase (NADP+)/methenyltetrahydrofolate cyclohydrolase|nr:bifunctional 5,10-methylene-tetrahydrofolate dehydrogenase/5,10-methylene-tetrahydrofolate cyclohydrolase [Gemmatimonadaceae bacterium]